MTNTLIVTREFPSESSPLAPHSGGYISNRWENVTIHAAQQRWLLYGEELEVVGVHRGIPSDREQDINVWGTFVDDIISRYVKTHWHRVQLNEMADEKRRADRDHDDD
jgi:hypothetical protein